MCVFTEKHNVESYCFTIVIQVRWGCFVQDSPWAWGGARNSHQRMKGARIFPYFPLFGEEALIRLRVMSQNLCRASDLYTFHK